MEYFDGFNFSKYKDFEIFHVRKEMAKPMYCDYIRLGFDSGLVLDYLHLFVSGAISARECDTLLNYRNRCLLDFGTPYPEFDPAECVCGSQSDSFEIGIDEGKFMGIPVFDGLFPEELFPSD